jgi:hypothetical protein
LFGCRFLVGLIGQISLENGGTQQAIRGMPRSFYQA